ncbi:MAG: HNH endonuclease [Thermoplasmata archaeon]|nr:HNH endonuclease [Thermoplasmata archaeon]MBE3142011.1 HNH endonuclease [Thermoplasmata archaeon]
MQKLERRDTYTPTDASQVRGNCDLVIKHGRCDQVLQSLKTLSNNSDVNQHQHTDGLNVNVYVLHQDGTPLMPCTPAKARHLLKQKKAKVVSRKPFTIQLLWNSEKNTQPIKLGIDSGYNKIGFSATMDKRELISGEVKLRDNISKLIAERAMYRRKKRNKLWYRPARFLNRKKNKDWLAPSIKHKLDSHIRLVEKIKKLLPITETIIEIANFDIQKIKNPDIEDKQYQQGEQLGFWNVREYVLYRDNHTCQHCFGKKKDSILEVHHINGKSEGATDRPEELMTVCKTCHEEHHAGIDIIPKKEIKQFKAETFMTSIRWKLVNSLGCNHTYGYITKSRRIELKLPKSHVNDAFVIAGGTIQERCRPFVAKQMRRNNRCLQLNRKGFKPSIRRQHYSLQPNDIVKYNDKEYCVKGVHCKGQCVIILDSIKNISVTTKKIELIVYGKGMELLYWLKPMVSLGGVV